MTLADAVTQRDSILQNLGISRAQYQGRMFEFPVGDARLKELAYLEELIDKLTAQSNNTPTNRCTLAIFNRG